MRQKKLLKKIRLLENQLQHIDNQISDALTLEETFHGFTVEDDEFHEWLSRARSAQSKKQTKLDILCDELDLIEDSSYNDFLEKIENLHSIIDSLQTKNKKLKNSNKKIHQERQIYQNVCWEIFSHIASREDIDVDYVLDLLLQANPDYPEQHRKKYKLPNLEKTLLRKIDPTQIAIFEEGDNIPSFLQKKLENT